MKRLKTFFEYLEESNKVISEKRYIGSCVDVGGNSAEICDIFPNASDMEVYVGNPDKEEEGKSKELSKKEWTQHIPVNRIKSKHIKGKHTFHYIAQDSIGRDMTPAESSLFFIYNAEQDIHYFYRK